MPKLHYKKAKPDARAERSGYVRAFSGKPTSVDEATRSFDIVITTEAPVRRWIPDPRLPEPVPDDVDCSYIEVDEVLLANGVDFSRARGMPLIDCHDTYTGISKILGKIDDLRVEGQSIVGRASLARLHAELLPDIVDGYFGNISAGYFHNPRTDAELIERAGDVPLLRVHRWVLTEGSIVPIGADADSFIRAFAPPSPMHQRSAPNKQEKSMDIEDLVAAAEAAVSAADEAIAAAEDAVPTELVERIKSLRGIRAEDTTDTGEADPEKKPDGETDGTRAEGDDETDADKADLENLRTAARSMGLGKLVDTMTLTRAKPAQIRAAINETLAKRGAHDVADGQVVVKQAARSVVESFNPTAVWASRREIQNKR